MAPTNAINGRNLPRDAINPITATPRSIRSFTNNPFIIAGPAGSVMLQYARWDKGPFNIFAHNIGDSNTKKPMMKINTIDQNFKVNLGTTNKNQKKITGRTKKPKPVLVVSENKPPIPNATK